MCLYSSIKNSYWSLNFISVYACLYVCAHNVILIRSVQLHHCFPHRALNSDKIKENNIANIFSTHPKLMELIFKPQNRASPPHLFKCPMHGLPASSSKYGSKPLHWPPSFHLSCWLQVLAQGPRQSDTCPYEALKILREGNFYLSVPSWSKRSAIVIVDQKGQSSKILRDIPKVKINWKLYEPKRNGNESPQVFESNSTP